MLGSRRPISSHPGASQYHLDHLLPLTRAASSPTTDPLKSGTRLTGRLRLRSLNRSKNHLPPSSPDSGTVSIYQSLRLTVINRFVASSWSPDGAHITASNAKNNNGYVFVAAVISRSSWSSNISLVGHENTIGVSVRVIRQSILDARLNSLRLLQAYNPHIFRRDPNKPIHTQNICSVVALGSNDLSLSVWQTKSARPLIVAKDVFAAPIMDLSW